MKRLTLLSVMALSVLVGSLTGCGAKKEPTISGSIQIAPALAKKFTDRAVLYVIARSEQSNAPLAVLRLDHLSFPMNYELSKAHAMMPTVPFEGKVNLIARISQMGDATKHAGDLEGTCAKNPVTIGDKGVDLTIDKVL